jgi:hypothetical protein
MQRFRPFGEIFILFPVFSFCVSNGSAIETADQEKLWGWAANWKSGEKGKKRAVNPRDRSRQKGMGEARVQNGTAQQ